MSNSQDVKLSSNYWDWSLLQSDDQLHYTLYHHHRTVAAGFFIPENVVLIIIFDYENDPVIKEDSPGTK